MSNQCTYAGKIYLFQMELWDLEAKKTKDAIPKQGRACDPLTVKFAGE